LSKKKNGSQSYLLTDPTVLRVESERLKSQAAVLFELEFDALKKHNITHPNTIIDFGCGNGSYLSLLQKKYSNSKLIGLDRNSKLLLQATNLFPNGDFQQTDITNPRDVRKIIRDTNPDLLVARYVAQHLSKVEVTKFVSAVASEKRPGRRLVLIDPDDSSTEFFPSNLQLVEMLNRKMNQQKSLGGDRTVGSKFRDILNSAGFTNIIQTKLELTKDLISIETFETIFWPVLYSGMPKNLTEAESSIIETARIWFENARTNNEYNIKYTIFLVSGE